MVIEVKCPKCGNVWKYKGHAVMATCTSCYRKVRVRSLPDPDPAPKAPAGVRKLLAKKPLERDGQTIQGETHEQPTGRKIQVQTITAPASVEEVRHTRTPLTPSELQEGHVCQHCHKPIRASQVAFWIDGHTNCMHRACLVDTAILEAAGDLQKASQTWDIPLQALEKRAAILRQHGKLNFNSNIA